MKYSINVRFVLIYKKARCIDALEAKIEKTLLIIKSKPLSFKTLNILNKTQSLILSLSNATGSI